MEIELINEFSIRKRSNKNRNIRIPNDIKPLQKGNYLIRIYKINFTND